MRHCPFTVNLSFLCDPVAIQQIQDKPKNPDNPVNPDIPNNPDNPVNPDKPKNPDNPVNPDKPKNPDSPTIVVDAVVVVGLVGAVQ